MNRLAQFITDQITQSVFNGNLPSIDDSVRPVDELKFTGMVFPTVGNLFYNEHNVGRPDYLGWFVPVREEKAE